MEAELSTAELDQGNPTNNDGEPSVDASNNTPTKRGRGRSMGAKKLKVSVTDVKLMETSDHVDKPSTESSPKKRGRPKTIDVDLPNGDTNTPRKGRGRPKGSVKRGPEDQPESSSETPRKRGRPKGSLNKKPRLEAEASSEGEGGAEGGVVKRRGGPREVKSQGGPKISAQEGSEEKVKRGRGRPKGSQNKKRTVGRPRKIPITPTTGKRGRQKIKPRGRPRKNPLPSAEELKKPRVWKKLGRPRKYPLADSPEDAPPAVRRSRGRPRKSESKKGAHLRKHQPSTPTTPRPDGTPRKRGRPPGSGKSDAKPGRKRGRPKSSANQDQASNETLDGNAEEKDKSDSSAEGEQEADNMEVQQDVAQDDGLGISSTA